ncbi:Hsp33 family molecular chaperone HslO [Ferruginivarius sediminum]|uniref:Molecular chaperone Hsp33 n=1 Tax=Ferruginivarius sediminum TaxID=2661937 RepID=A0A369TF74_9PROT|nr:Hsp33 family molecular chaperone HslO [Ferruginivarius sediminum]RDD61556.1 molecular chaperone Hsp33 [Ferruginivarius sediminum]
MTSESSGEHVRGPDDIIQPFMLESSGVRGRLVRVGEVADTIIRRHDYPEPVARLLGEMLALAGLLSAMLKYEGIFTLQTSGDGPVRLMVVDFTSEGAVRGYAQYNAEEVARAAPDAAGGNADVLRLLGSGQLAFTVDHAGAKEQYQGIVELQGRTLAECMHHYFQQSEQIASGIRLYADRVREADGAARWRAGGLILQRLPEEAGAKDLEGIDEDDAWRRAVILMSSCTNRELCDPALTPYELLFRLFHEDGVRVYESHGLEDRCRCSRTRVANVLRAMPAEEMSDLKADDGTVQVTCQFCNRLYVFDDDDIAALHAS